MKGFLVLETGEVFSGLWHGGAERVGEVVFNTSHSGYEEIVTDPSYYSQILVMTSPMQGNYGTHNEDWESRQVWAQGFVCVDVTSRGSGNSWFHKMSDLNVPVLSGVDTRNLVLRLRSQGTPWGGLVQAETPESARERVLGLLAKFKPEQGLDWTQTVCRKQVEDVKGLLATGPRIAAVDFGMKENILRNLLQISSQVRVFPSFAGAEEILSWAPDAILLSNGPGDPLDVRKGVETVRQLVGQKPIFGICMGHQVLALALGAKTLKLKFGHRGANHPVRDDLMKSIYITSQNHGYAVKTDSLPQGVRQTHVNLYDGTCEGLDMESKKCMSVQFHPEASPGPHDAQPLFRFFKERWL